MAFHFTESSFASTEDWKENICQQNLSLAELKFTEWTSALIVFIILIIDDKGQNYTHGYIYYSSTGVGIECFSWTNKISSML